MALNKSLFSATNKRRKSINMKLPIELNNYSNYGTSIDDSKEGKQSCDLIFSKSMKDDFVSFLEREKRSAREFEEFLGIGGFKELKEALKECTDPREFIDSLGKSQKDEVIGEMLSEVICKWRNN